MTEEEQKAAIARLQIYEGAYLGLAEFSDIVGISKQALSNRRRRGQLPEPTYDLAQGPVWTKDQVRGWISHQTP